MSDIIIKYKLKRILNYTNVNQYSPTAQIAFIDSSIFGTPPFFFFLIITGFYHQACTAQQLLYTALPRNKSCTVTDWSCWMMSSSSLRYLSLSSSTRRRCLWRGSSCFLRASVTRTFSSASVRFSSVRTESWFSSCMKKKPHVKKQHHRNTRTLSKYLEISCGNVSLLGLWSIACWRYESCYFIYHKILSH